MATELELALQSISNNTQLTQAEKTEIKQGLKELANADGSLGANDRIWLREQIAAATAPAPTPTTNTGADTWEPPLRDPWKGPIDENGNINPITKPTTPTTGTGPTSPAPADTPPGYMWVWDEASKSWKLVKDPNYKAPGEPGWTQQQVDGAQKVFGDLLRSYGLEGLIGIANDLIVRWGPNNSAVVMSYLKESAPYKERFKGNEYRIANGYGAISEGEYIATESEIRAKMRDFGLDGVFYTREKLAGLIGGDVSADEVTDRLTTAKKIVDNADPLIKSSLVNLYGAHFGDLIGYVLEPKLAFEQLRRKVNAGIVYGVASGKNFTLDRTLSEQIGDLTYGDERTARMEFETIAQMRDSTERLKYIDPDQSITQTDVVESRFGLDEEASKKYRTLQSRERARFSGSSGIGRSSLGSSGGRV